VDLERLLDIRVAGDPAIAPDGRIAHTVSAVFTEPGRTAESRIWIAEPDGRTSRQATRGPGVDSLPRWSPAGDALAFASDRDHPGRMALYLLEPGGEARPLGDVPGSVEAIAWDRTGTRVLVLAADPGSDRAGADSATRIEDDGERDPEVRRPHAHWRRLHLVDRATGATTRTGPDELNVWEVDWRGGPVAAVVSDDPAESGWYDARIALIDLRSGSAATLHEPAHQVSQVRLSPDGERVAFVEGFCSDRGLLAGETTIVPASGGDPQVLAPELDVGGLTWGDDGRLWFGAVRGLENACGWFSAGGEPRVVWSGPASLTSTWLPVVAAAPNGHLLAAPHSSWDEPPELRVLRVDDHDARWQAVTALNSALAGTPRPSCQRVSWSAADGLEIEGLLVRPAGASGPLPLIVNVHGGPTAAYQWGYPRLRDLWPADAGYALLLPNPRGSSGRGQAFARANLGDMGGGDLADILAGVDALVEADLVDGRRVGIMGGSYGGFMAAWAVTQTDRFGASVAIAAVTDWLSFHNTTNIGRFDELFLDGDPYDPGSGYLPRSPVMHARRVRTPTLVMHGQLDLCVPVSQAHELYQALADAGVTTELVVYPREGHGWQERAHQLDGCRRMREWFDRHLAGP
jgi:dipeptidyl aminopeptidase/acylaminoacyl peptidase